MISIAHSGQLYPFKNSSGEKALNPFETSYVLWIPHWRIWSDIYRICIPLSRREHFWEAFAAIDAQRKLDLKSDVICTPRSPIS